MVFDQCAWMFRIECVLYLDRYVLDTYGIYRWGIDNLGTEVTKLHRLNITQFINGVGSLDNTWVGSHETINISPYLQDLCIESSSNNRCGIVRTAPSQIRSLHGISVTRNEARNHSHLWYVFESFLDKLVRQLRIQRVLSVLLFRTDEITAVHALAALDEHALTRRRADARKVGERHGYHDRAGTGRDQHDQRVVNPLREAAQAEQGREKRDQERQADHDRRIDRREPRDQLFALSLARRRVLDNLQDARGSAVACRLCRAYFQQAVAVHAAAEYLVALFHRYGQALARQGGVVDRGRSLDDDAVKRNPRVRLDKHRRADRDAFRRDLGFRSV